MRRFVRPFSLLLVAAGAFASATSLRAAAVNVDTFATDQGPVTLSTAPNTVNDWVNDSGAGTILGAERNIRISGSSVAGGSITAQASSGQLTITRPSGSTGEVDLWWDGQSNSSSFSTTGLGGADLTAGGNTGFQINSVSSSSTTLRMQIYVYSSAGTSHKFFTLPSGSGTIEIPFAEFETSGFGADFTSAGAIYLYTADNSGAWSLTLNSIKLAYLSRIFNDGFETADYCVWSSASQPC